jgi:hypothetical protein
MKFLARRRRFPTARQQLVAARQKRREASAKWQFATQGGAIVELRSKRFETRWHPWRGRPGVVDTPYEVDGFVWECLGCDAIGRDPGSYEGDYLPSEREVARDEANAHAEKCRALPKPEVSR